MANIVLGAAGAVVGGIFGGPGGASWGWMIGSTLGGFLGSKGKGTNTVQPLQDLKVPGAEYGQPILWLRGAYATSGQVWWNGDKIPTYHTETSSAGGKGDTPENTTTTITYSIDMLIGLADLEIVGVGRIWDNGTLIREGRVAQSVDSENWDRLTVYTGASGQLADPDYEAAIDEEFGVGLAPAYRGRGTVFIKGLKLGQSGQLRNLVFEVIVDGTFGAALLEYFGANENTSGTADCCLYDSVNNVILFGCGPATINTTGGAGRVEVFDCNSKSFLTPIEPGVDARWPASNVGTVTPAARYSHLAYGKFYTGVTVEDGDGFNEHGGTGIYDVATREFIRLADYETPEPVPNTIAGYCFGIDEANNTMMIGGGISGNQLAYLVDLTSAGLPTESTPLGFSPGVSVQAISYGIADAAGDYWFMEDTVTTTFCRTFVGSDGVDKELHSVGADEFNPYTRAFTYDSGRDRIYYFSEDMQWLKYFHCASRTYARLNLVAFSTMGNLANTNNANASITYDSTNDRILLLKGTGQTVTLTVVDPDTGAISSTTSADSIAEFGSNNRLISQAAYNPDQDAIYAMTYRGGGTLPAGIGEFGFGTTPGCISVADAQASICERAGLSPSQYDVTALASITRRVCCLPWADISGGAGLTDMLMSAYFYDCTVSDKIKFVPRGGSPAATIEFEELGAAEGQSNGEGLPLRNVSDLENAAQLALTAINIDADYQSATEYSDRLISHTSVTVEPIGLSLGMTPAELKKVADVIIRDRALSVWSASFSTQGDRCALEPTDVVTITGADGSTYRMRLLRRVDSFPLLTWEAVLDSASVLSTQGITSADYTSSTQVVPVSRAEAKLLDIPILRDSDDDIGYYSAMRGFGTNWPGGELYRSNDNVTYTQLYAAADAAVMGFVSGSPLADYSGARVLDEKNTVTVNVYPGELLSSTRDIILNDQRVNAVLIGDEVIQYITATLVSEGIYTLSRLLRGSRGTEIAMTGHTASERVVLLREFGLRRVVPTNSELGVEKHYKVITRGRLLASTTPFLFTPNALGKTPFSCFDLRATRDGSNNVTFTWQRRSRYEVRAIGDMGINVPLGEPTEAYELDIYEDSSDGADVVRTISASTTTATYSAANQTSDGLSPGDYITVSLYQISDVVGRGQVHEGVV